MCFTYVCVVVVKKGKKCVVVVVVVVFMHQSRVSRAREGFIMLSLRVL